MSTISRFVRWALAALFLGHSANGAVLVVDPLDPTKFDKIQLAINAASDGDTILIKQAGVYSGLTVDGRSLTILADDGLDVQVGFFPIVSIRIRNLAADQHVVLRGIDGAVELVDNAGPVRFEDCRIKGVIGSCSEVHVTPGSPGLAVTNSTSVSLVRCEVIGGDGVTVDIGWFVCHAPGGPGLQAFDSVVVLYDTTVEGTPPILPFSSTVYDGLSPGRHFEATSPLRKNQAGQLRFAGQPGDVVLLLIAAGPGTLPVPLYQGVLLLGPISAAVVLGTLPGPDGELAIPLVITDLPPPGVDAVDLHLQAAFGVGPTQGLLGPASIVTVLDPAF